MIYKKINNLFKNMTSKSFYSGLQWVIYYNFFKYFSPNLKIFINLINKFDGYIEKIDKIGFKKWYDNQSNK